MTPLASRGICTVHRCLAFAPAAGVKTPSTSTPAGHESELLLTSLTIVKPHLFVVQLETTKTYASLSPRLLRAGRHSGSRGVSRNPEKKASAAGNDD